MNAETLKGIRRASVTFAAIGLILLLANTGFAQSASKGGGGSSIQISAVSPSTSTVGASIKISGSGFSSTASLNSVQFSAAKAATVTGVITAASSTSLTVTVPVGATTGKVYVQNGSARSNGIQFKVVSNLPPAVDAGVGQTIVLPNVANLSGNVTDDGLPTSTLSVSWSKANGPGNVTFGNSNSQNSTAAFSLPGTYTLRLTASDSTLTASADVTVVANTTSTNRAPVVNAGPDQTMTLPAVANLAGTVVDDGLPTGSTLITTWSKMSGPGVVTFGSSSAQSTTAIFSTAGTYVLRLTANDGSLSGQDDMTIVAASAVTNQAPIGNAGVDQTITLPAVANLTGTAVDDGLPIGSNVVTSWSKVSGPSAVTFGSPTNLSTTATFSAAGTYVLRLTVSDSALSTSDEITVNVNPASAVNPTTTDSIAVMAGALGLQGQPNWFFYNAADAPEGAFMGWMYQAQTLNAVVRLPRQLDPGRYYVFFYGIAYDSKETLYGSIGGGTSTSVVLDDRDDNRYWTNRAVVDVSSASDALQVTITRNPSVTWDQRYLFRGLYITSDSQETVTWDSIAVKIALPTVMDDSAPIKGNLVPNGGFETGVDAAWGFVGEGGGRTVPVNTMADSTLSYEGQASLKLTFDAATRTSPTNSAEEIYSRVYHLKANKKYTLSMWMRTSPSLTTTAKVSLINSYAPPPGYPAQYSISSGMVTITDTWKRVSVTGYLLDYPSSDYQIYIGTGGPSGGYLLIDAVQLEEGDLTAYAPAAEVEAAPIISMTAHPGNIYYIDETLSTDLTVRNNMSSAKTKTLSYNIYDHTNKIVRQGSLNLSIAANSTQHFSFDLSTGGKQGIFRVVTWIENDDRTEREITYSVIPRPTTMGLDSTSLLGIHANHTDFQLKLLQRLGMKWTRALSPSTFCRWNVVEPADNQFVWYDSEVQLASSYGLTTMCTIGTNDYWPAWAGQGGLPDLNKWQEFVGQLVAHYKPWIKHWEIWNESYQVFTPDFYAQMLKRAADAIEANDATAKIIGMGGDPPAYIQAVINSLQAQYPSWDWKQHIDVLSTHDYPGGTAPESLKPIITTYGVPVWNTETGAWDQGFYQGVNSNFVTWGKNLWPHIDASRYYEGMIGAADELVANFMRTIASGQTNYFYYDSRYYVAPNYFKHHPTILEYDGTVRAKGIAYAIAGSLIDHSVGMGNASSDPNSYVLVFDKPSGPIASLFSADRKPRQITLSLAFSQFQVLDMMGNPINAGTTIAFGRIPIYIKGIGISAATLKSALQTATIAMRADTTAPAVSISDAPRGPIPSGTFRVRWIGLDDTSYPNLGEINPESNAPSETPNPNAIVYSYYLNGYSASWSSWTAATFADFSNVPSGSYTFSVMATDAAGNQSAAVTRSIVIQ